MKYFPVYKCNICNELMRGTEDTYEVKEEELPSIIAKIISRQQYASNSYLQDKIVPMYITHKCGGCTGIGLAVFAGFLPETEENK